ncbi:MAG TPA: hypothetical protein VI980_01045 [Acidimicrobiia bacterium]|nr:hypothetical protein [Acidimicrobiia bacterium]
MISAKIPPMVEHDTKEARTGKAVIRGVLVGLPLGIVGMTLAVWMITGLDAFDSFATAIIPGVLLGAFGGGFVGVTLSMEE